MQGKNLSRRQHICGTLAMMITSAMTMFIVTARMNILPNIMSEFDGMAYFSITSILGSLTMSIMLPIAGSLGDLLGRKKVYCVGIVGYILALLACVFANSTAAIMIGLALTGIFYGVLYGPQLALYYDLYTDEQRPRYLSYFSVGTAVACLLGPMVGGWCVDTVGWRYVFLLIVPVAALALVLGILGVPAVAADHAGKRVDYAGIALFVLTVMPLLYALTAGGKTYPWFSVQIAVLIGVALVSGILLVLCERKKSNPLIPLRLFTSNKTYMVIMLVIITCGFCYSCMNYLSIYYQAIRGLSATASGSAALPRQIAQVAMSMFTGAFLAKQSRRRYKAAFYGTVISYIFSMFMMAFYNSATPMFLLYTVELFYGAPNGVQAIATNALAMKALDEESMGSGMAFVGFAGTFGSSLGGAIIGCILNQFWNVDKLMPAAVRAALSAENLAALGNTNTIQSAAAIAQIRATLPADLFSAFDSGVEAVKLGLNRGLSVTFALFGVCLVGTLIVLMRGKWANVIEEDKN